MGRVHVGQFASGCHVAGAIAPAMASCSLQIVSCCSDDCKTAPIARRRCTNRPERSGQWQEGQQQVPALECSTTGCFFSVRSLNCLSIIRAC